MWIFKPTILVPILFGTFITASSPQQPVPLDKLDKNKEYVCVEWRGSADYSQKQPTVCLKWEVKEKPLHRRI